MRKHILHVGGVALNLDFAQVVDFVKERLGKEVEMGGCKGPITTFIVEPFIPHNEEFYLNIVSDLLGNSIRFSECGGIDIEENWDKIFLDVKTIFVPTGVAFTSEVSAPLVATLPLEIKAELEDFIKAVFTLFQGMNPFALVDGKPYPLDMRGELDDTAAFKNFKNVLAYYFQYHLTLLLLCFGWGSIEFPMPFGRVMCPAEKFIHRLDESCSKGLAMNPKASCRHVNFEILLLVPLIDYNVCLLECLLGILKHVLVVINSYTSRKPYCHCLGAMKTCVAQSVFCTSVTMRR
ncbi:ATP-citrate synthase alpha chain protein 1 [Pyrus ussuriensis x Pyrus communis]|uniref:ATP-citrate synthase alpha chain protein 1 n=1 Tax=Pyrus ussuriensis x Pyrus communis TaxID=2448454 RepID=A0A5N5FLY2_9ROSA|nr:ATP-citrate synthase alpha chain protein 1 [Pyrus ussuriensis x Pyrus communis]